MAEKHDNQNTLPSLTLAEAKEKAKTLLVSTAGKGPQGRDRLGLFAEWLKSDPSEFRCVSLWVESKGVHRGTLQKWGGRMFWNRARDAVRHEALTRAIEKAPEDLEKKFEKQLRIVSKLEDSIEHKVDQIREMQKSGQANPFEASLIEGLIDGLSELVKTNILLKNDGVQRHELKSVNLHAAVVQSLRERDQRLGVQD